MTQIYDLIIDPGHGGSDPGAVKGNRLEKDWTLKISLYQYKRFKELGVNVDLTRDSDRTLSQSERTGSVKRGKFCISNHLNAGGGDRGEVIHSIYDNGRLANVLKDELLSVGQSSIKVYFRKGASGDYYYMHRETGATVTNIVEYCFLDNEADFAHFSANWEAYAEAIVRGFCRYIGHRYSEPRKPEPIQAPKTGAMYRVVTGSFSEKENAEKRVAELKSKGFDSFIDIK